MILCWVRDSFFHGQSQAPVPLNDLNLYHWTVFGLPSMKRLPTNRPTSRSVCSTNATMSMQRCHCICHGKMRAIFVLMLALTCWVSIGPNSLMANFLLSTFFLGIQVAQEATAVPNRNAHMKKLNPIPFHERAVPHQCAVTVDACCVRLGCSGNATYSKS